MGVVSVKGRDLRTYIKVHDGIADHPKIEGLSDRAFRLLIETWCWCSRHLTDGQVPQSTWIKRGTAKTRAELISAELAEDCGEVIVMHDYVEHQRTAAEVEERRAVRRKASLRGNHQRWHTGPNGTPDPACEHCVSPQGPIPPGTGLGSHLGQPRDPTRDNGRNPIEVHTEVEVEVQKPKPSEASASGAAAPPLTLCPPLGDNAPARSKPATGDKITARDVVATWVDACRGNGTEPSKAQIGQVGRTAKELLAHNEPQRVLNAAHVAGAKGYSTIDRELTAIAGRANGGRNGHTTYKNPAPDAYVVGELI